MFMFLWKFIYDNPVAIISLVISILGSDYLRGKLFSGAAKVKTKASAHPILAILVSFLVGVLVTFLFYIVPFLHPSSNCSYCASGDYPQSLPLGLQIVIGILAGIVAYSLIVTFTLSFQRMKYNK